MTKRYGSGPVIVESLDWMFSPGTITGLVGPNGSGKTTLLRLLSCLAYPTAGHIRFGDLNIHKHPYRYLRAVGLVHASGDLPQHLTAVELLEWILRARDGWSGDAPDEIEQLLDRVRLDERRHNLIGTYSSGMLQKTQLAAALVHRPLVLLMDEPLRGLDAESTAAALDLLTEHRIAGGLAVIASHARTRLGDFWDAVLELG